MHIREVTERRSEEQGRQYNKEGISSREGSSRGGQDWGCDNHCESKKSKVNAREPKWPRQQCLEHDPAELETGLHRDDKDY